VLLSGILCAWGGGGGLRSLVALQMCVRNLGLNSVVETSPVRQWCHVDTCH
jgi:hypothetical protein